MTEMLVSLDPRTGSEVGSIPATPLDEIPEIVERGRKAFAMWSALDHRERRFFLGELKRTVLARGEEIAGLVAAETGKSVSDAFAYDVLTALTVIDHYARKAEGYLARRRASSWPFLTTRGWTDYEPLGVAGVISPWNYPFFLPVIPMVTALAAGCAVVVKPSEVTPLTGALLPELCEQVGLPADLVQVVQGGAAAGEALVAGGIDVVAFTGSTRVGRLVARAAGERLIPTVLELGGKDPMLVLEDADIGQAARAAVWGSMVNAGQTCIAVERVYVVDSVFDRFLDRVLQEVDRLDVGSGDRGDIGPITYPPQLETIERQVRDAVEKGARILRGGDRVEFAGGGLYYRPTVIVDVDPTMTLIQDETFGPVLPVIRVADEESAMAAANDSAFGLHASVWTRDRRRGESVAVRLRSGSVAVNDVGVNFIVPGLPFGGIGDSGAGGVNFGPEGIRAYCSIRSLTAARLRRPTTRLLGAWYPRRVGLRYWRGLARALFRW